MNTEEGSSLANFSVIHNTLDKISFHRNTDHALHIQILFLLLQQNEEMEFMYIYLITLFQILYLIGMPGIEKIKQSHKSYKEY